ncbi:hypothetical protein F5Y15DRAFT_141012 [Xylariaceae sp. FL0016]|nr:hypothetical protein F5Y15DRAFT_141012 [Xylariaceae sp. FL0016]
MESAFESIHRTPSRGGAGGGVSGGGPGTGAGAVASDAVTTRTAPATIAPPAASATVTATGTNPTSLTSPPTLDQDHHHNNAATSSQSASSPPSSSHNVLLHAHRQSHNSSKLPAFRFADLKKESIALPSLLPHQHQHIPPSPVSPDTDQQPETEPDRPHQNPHPSPHHNNSQHPVSPEQSRQDKSTPDRSRAATSQSISAILPATATANANQSASLDSSPTISQAPQTTLNTHSITSPSESAETIRPLQLQRRVTSETEPTSGQHTRENSDGALSTGSSTSSWAQGQRELLLPKTVQRSVSDDRRTSVRRPPLSYKPPVGSNASGGTASIPPIRSFRSSGERRSLVLDMSRTTRTYDVGDDYGDPNHRDRTLRALEGRRGDEQITPPDSATDRTHSDDSGDIFLKIAREDPLNRYADSNGAYAENHSAITRVARSGRRPLSMALSTNNPSSPPQVSRRLSDQETTRARGYSNSHDQSVDRNAPPISFRGFTRDRQPDDLKLRGTGALRASPLTPRTTTHHDPTSDSSSAYARRRQSSMDAGSSLNRMTSLKQNSVNYSHPRSYNSSPLVPRPSDTQAHDMHSSEAHHGVEGTNSTASTAAPSTVWDELDDLKSRINRLELTGKLPPSSNAAISRASEERPATAHTNATTMSASPKRGNASVAPTTAESTASQKECHPLLHNALTKSKLLLSADVYSSLETAATDALALASMMGTAGQPGPISSGASIVGGGAVTDRQLRRKADSVCRSLTELCLALSEGAVQTKSQQVTTPPEDEDQTVTSPTVTKFSGIAAQRRPSASAERSLALQTSPRTMTRYEERRNSVLMGSALPSPRYSVNTPATPTDATAGRRTSLLLSRTRRAGTEEPDEGRRSSLLRTRRAGTEEPEDYSDRKTVVGRARRGTVEDGDAETRFRTPSRAVTEVQGVRSAGRDFSSQLPTPASKETDPLGASALPRRRLPTTGLNTRLAQPSTASAIATPSRRYFDRPTPTREMASYETKPAEEHVQHHQRQGSLTRAGSLNKRSERRSMLATPSATNSYR